jgi:predicted membrane protein
MIRGRALVGILLIALGALFLLDKADVLDAGDTIAQWWPVILIAAGLLYLGVSPRHVLVPGVLIIAGLALLAGSLDFVDVNVTKFIWPVVLVLAGLWVIFGSNRGGASVGDRVNSLVVFFGRDVVSNSQQFSGGSILTAFGGTEVDLRNARPVDGGAAVDVVCAFGGVGFLVPEGWRVEITGLPLFGGWSDKTRREPLGVDAPVLSIEALVAFGGLELKHGKN